MFIFRKPRFLRSDYLMKTCLEVAANYVNLSKEAPDDYERLQCLRNASMALQAASNYGGFLSVKDMEKWVKNNQKND